MTSKQLITNHLDLWTSTIKSKATQGRGSNSKRELYGIKKLRELILELAVRGKLVPQDPNDEPACELLKRIAAEKEQLIKDKKIKKQKPLPPISEEEKPFELPTGWEWNQLGNLSSDIHYGFTASAKPENEGIRLLRITDIQNDRVNWTTVPGCEITDTKASGYLLDIDDILIARTGGTIGKSYLVENINVKAVFASYLIRVKRISAMYSAYIKTYLGSATYWTQLYDNASGTGQPNVNASALKQLIVPIPPLEEQHRIVAKVDELMALCDQLEQQSETQFDAHQQLVDTLLGALTNSKNAEELSENWAKISQHFDTLITTGVEGERAVEQLKQTILQLAVMGKLVPQNPNDEPASELLKRIAAEKEQLIKDKKIKKQKPLPPISEEEKPFELPKRWEWCRLGGCSYIFSGNSFKSEDFDQISGVRVIKITNAGVGELIETNDYLPKSFLEKYSGYRVFEGDLIIALTRPYISTGLKVSICPPSYHNSLLNQRVAAIRTITDKHFLYYFMQSNFVLGLYKRRFGGSGLQPNLKMNDVSELVFPLPPLKEQHRIVAKVDELMALCDQLKTRLQNAQTTQLQLADAVVEQALV